MTIDAVQDRYMAILNESLMISEKRLSGTLPLIAILGVTQPSIPWRPICICPPSAILEMLSPQTLSTMETSLTVFVGALAIST
jgi:hypothetical protein